MLPSDLTGLSRDNSGAATLWEFLSSQFAGHSDQSRFKELSCYALGLTSVFPDVQLIPSDHLYLQSFTAIHAAASGKEDETKKIIDVPEEFDFLENTCNLRSYSPVQISSLVSLKTLRPSRQTAALTMVRDEGLYILEWLAHHQAIGVEHFFVYSNDNSDGSEALLEALANSGVITLLRNKLQKGVNPQRKAYQHALQFLVPLRKYEWVFVIDADEFVVPDSALNFRVSPLIEALRQCFQQKLPSAILFPWKWCLTDRAFMRNVGLLSDRFPHAIPHSGFKSLIRLDAVEELCQVHLPTVHESEVYVDTEFSRITHDKVWTAPKSGARGWIHHYWGKSFVEFVMKKNRGDDLGLEKLFRRDYSTFFEWTAEWTRENYDPIPVELSARKQERFHLLLELPGVRSAAEEIERNVVREEAVMAADPELRRVYQDLLSSTSGTLRPAMVPGQ